MTQFGLRVATACAMGALAIGVAACGDDSSDSGSSSSSGGGGGGGGDKVVVGLITKTESNPFFVKMKDAAQKAADANNAELVTAAGKQDTDNQSQVTAIENMTTRGAKGILITPADSKAIVPAIKKARDAGVTVIALDTPTEPEDAADALPDRCRGTCMSTHRCVRGVTKSACRRRPWNGPP
jgi:fructose transport system substrate-binding protein